MSARNRRLRLSFAALAMVLLGRCASPGSQAPAATPPPATGPAELPGAIRWVRRSTEFRALAYQAYAVATQHLRDTVPTLSGTPWGVVIVTNRDDLRCEPTRADLERLGVAPDLVLCKPPGESDKNPRFERVQRGTASPELPALAVVAWIGDNIQDFPGLTQEGR